MCFYSVFLFKTTGPLFLFYSFQVIDKYLLFKNAQKLILAKLFLISHLRKQIHTKVLRKLVFGIELILNYRVYYGNLFSKNPYHLQYKATEWLLYETAF